MEVLIARSRGDMKSERFWTAALDRLLDTYIEESKNAE